MVDFDSVFLTVMFLSCLYMKRPPGIMMAGALRGKVIFVISINPTYYLIHVFIARENVPALHF